MVEILHQAFPPNYVLSLRPQTTYNVEKWQQLETPGAHFTEPSIYSKHDTFMKCFISFSDVFGQLCNVSTNILDLDSFGIVKQTEPINIEGVVQ